MNDYIELMILSYFKQNSEYSYAELAQLLGLPIITVSNHIENLISRNLLEYKDRLITLSFKGRIVLQNSELEFYDYFNTNINFDNFRNNAWPIERVYVPDNFLKKVR